MAIMIAFNSYIKSRQMLNLFSQRYFKHVQYTQGSFLISLDNIFCIHHQKQL